MRSARTGSLPSWRHFLQRHPVSSYFVLTYAVSWVGAFLVVAPLLLRGAPVPKERGPLMFPAMLLGPSMVGTVLTCILDGRAGVRGVLSRMRQFRFDVRWYALLLVPPVLILSILWCLKNLVSPVFAPNMFLIGAGFGVVAGFFEEIGWMGYAFPKMLQTKSVVAAGAMLGLLWGLWHLPVIDYLGAATPHRAYLTPYFFAFTAVLVATRLLISWMYVKTRSLPLCQLMHASSTSSLVIFSPAHATARQEMLWYWVYAGALWITVAVLASILRRQEAK